MSTLIELLKGGVIVGVSVLIMGYLLKVNKPPQWVQVDVIHLIQRHALQLGKQNLSEQKIKEKTAHFIPRLHAIAHTLSKKHKVLVVAKGVTLSALPDWTEKLAQLLEDSS